jgi:hypothetical protein
MLRLFGKKSELPPILPILLEFWLSWLSFAVRANLALIGSDAVSKANILLLRSDYMPQFGRTISISMSPACLPQGTAENFWVGDHICDSFWFLC